MADLTGITAVRPTLNTAISRVKYGATLGLGEPVYLDAADSEHKPTDANVEATAVAVGITMTAGVDGGHGVIATGGSILLIGTTMAVGEPHAVSATAGKIAPETDLVLNDYVTRLGTASTATKLDLDFQVTGVQHA